MAKNMNAVFKMLALGMAVVLIAGCSDAANTGQSKESVNPFGKHIKPKQDLLSLKRQAEAGDAAAQFALGLRYHEGKGVAKDTAQALVWWRKAAEQGNSDAQYTLGEIYSNPFSGIVDDIPKDATQAVAWYRKAAEQGNPGAQFKLGWMYDEGEGVPKDVVQAMVWFRKAAEQGYAIAQNKLGVMYDQGEGVPKDVVQAVVWFRKAAEQGDATAQFNLGLMYDQGKGVPKDAVQAVAWFRKAATQGDPDAQVRLSFAYATGRGVRPNVVFGYLWINLAAAKDPKYAQHRDDYESGRGYISKRVDWVIENTKPYPKQITEGQRLASLWKPGTNPESGYKTTGPKDYCEQHLLRLLNCPDAPTSPAAEAAAPADASRRDDVMEKTVVGSAFFVSKQGHLLTNRHVVRDCRQVRLSGSDKPLKVLPQDEVNDLALLQMAGKPKDVAVFRATNDLRQGESIAAYGYPLQGALAAGGNLSPGVVSALAGLGNNTSQIQITAPVQQGNSGGPVLDSKGQVVGVVVQKLDAVKVAKLTGDVPQNVNFAINASTTRAFLDSNQVQYQTGGWWNVRQKDLTDIAEDARAYTVVVECWK